MRRAPRSARASSSAKSTRRGWSGGRRSPRLNSEGGRIGRAGRLDLKRLVPQRADGRRQNSGGPFVPWNMQTGDQPQAAPAATTPDIVRLDELLRLLRSMPLSAPVHDFAITSAFGYRT